MKSGFYEYFVPQGTEIQELWESCLFVIDANILLNLYRYSDYTRNEFIKILATIGNRLWLPHQAAQEYFNNRLQVIFSQEKSYEDATKTIESLKNDLNDNRKHPFISDRLLKQLTQVLGKVTHELNQNKGIHSERTTDDEIKDSICCLFEGKVGLPYTKEQLTTICKEGEERYKNKVPPGYKDIGKSETESSPLNSYKRYGDLIIWRQIIAKASNENKSVIFINDDKKEDWWLKFGGKAFGPRPELIREFKEQTNNNFYMYQADSFLRFAANYFKQNVEDKAFSEVRDLRMLDIDSNSEMHILKEAENKLTSLLEYRNMLRKKLNRLQKTRNDMLVMHSFASEQGELHPEKTDLLEQYVEYGNMIESIDKEIDSVRYELDRLILQQPF